jgi:hypothetical protein
MPVGEDGLTTVVPPPIGARSTRASGPVHAVGPGSIVEVLPAIPNGSAWTGFLFVSAMYRASTIARRASLPRRRVGVPEAATLPILLEFALHDDSSRSRF